jgi:poly(glycerol-phosphate) alpha-glucosyltransferase
VSYDIGYGPREQISDGVDGFLVAPGDVEGFAHRVAELLGSPDLVARMSAAAAANATAYGPRQFLAQWEAAVRGAIARRPARTRLEEVELAQVSLRARPFGRIALAARLRLAGRSRRSEPAAARFELAAVDRASGAVRALPLDAALCDDGRFALSARLRRGDVPAGGRLRLRLVWENSAWETVLARAAADGALQLRPGLAVA